MKMDDLNIESAFHRVLILISSSVLDHRLCCYVTMIVIEHLKKKTSGGENLLLSSLP